MRIGFFGGSFDPPHLGHYLAVVDATERLGLDQVVWIPAAQQPLKVEDLKAEDIVAPAQPSSEAFSETSSPVEPLEVNPHSANAEARYLMVQGVAELHPRFKASRIEIDRPGLSYTVATVEALAQQYPGDERILLVGEDAWSRFAEWREPDRIQQFVHIEVIARTAGSEFPGRVVELSSTEIRGRVRAGLPIRGFVPDAVAAIIESKGLYRW